MRVLAHGITEHLRVALHEGLHERGEVISISGKLETLLSAVRSEGADALVMDRTTLDTSPVGFLGLLRSAAPTLTCTLWDDDAEELSLTNGFDDWIAPSDGPGQIAENLRSSTARRLQQIHASRRSAERRVLVVDDEPHIVQTVAVPLRRHGFIVNTATSGMEALRFLRRTPVHVLLTDQQMPGMNGVEVVQAALRYDPSISPILFTGLDDPNVMLEALRAGAVDYIEKPVASQDLMHSIERAWARSVGAPQRWRWYETNDDDPIDVLVVDGEDAGKSHDMLANAEGCWRCTTVNSLVAARKILATRAFDAVLVDLRLPDSDGLDTVLATVARAGDAAVVVMSTTPDSELFDQLMLAGAQDFLRKDRLSADLLSSRLGGAVERMRAMLQNNAALSTMRSGDAIWMNVLERTSDAIIVVDRGGYVLASNSAAEHFFDRDDDELCGANLALPQPLDDGGELEVFTRDGTTRTGEVRTTSVRWGAKMANVVTIHDITVRRERERELDRTKAMLERTNAKLERLAAIDPLTSVFNRRGIEATLLKSLDTARRTGARVTACLVDCDNFKDVNVRLGRGVGDLVLKRLASRIEGALRKCDSIGRIGGDEFLVVMPQTREAEAEMVAERLRIAVAATPIVIDGDEWQQTTSVGVCIVPWDTSSLEELLPRCELALQRSKAEGKNAVSNSLGPATSRPLVSSLVETLVTGDALRVVAQPIINLRDGSIAGFELLSRCNHALFESPSRFFALAREHGMATALDLQCLKACIAAAATLPGSGAIHVNMLPSTMLDVEVGALLAMFGDNQRLCVELSEEQFIGDPSELVERIGALRERGIRLAIDDVGRGHGTLDSVLFLEPEIVKIDRELVSHADTDVRRKRLLGRLVALGQALECEVVAEGIEREEEAVLLRDLGVVHAQGFLWYRPMELTDLADLPKH